MRYSSPETSHRQAAEVGALGNWPTLVTTYALIVTASLLLAVAEHSWHYVFVVVVACGAHAVIVGPGGPSFISGRLDKLLALAALAFGLIQSAAANVHVSYGLAHFLIMVQLLKLYGPHRMRDIRLIQVTAVFEVLVAGGWAFDLIYLPVFVLVSFSLMANMMAMELQPAPDAEGGSVAGHEGQTGAWRDLVSALWLPAAAVFACTALLFIVLPRATVYWSWHQPLPTVMTAFSENVSLYDVGRMRQSNAAVMQVTFMRADSPDGERVRPPRLLMRGASRPLYRDGQWFDYGAAQRIAEAGRGRESGRAFHEFTSTSVYRLEDSDVPRQRIRQHVLYEARGTQRLFALYRPLEDTGLPYGGAVPPISHDLPSASRIRPGQTYEVVSLVPEFTAEQLRQARVPRPASPWHFFWEVPESLRPTLERTAAEIERLYAPSSDYGRIVAAQSYLMGANRFSYTLDLPEFGVQEPIEAFLTTTRRGSCEQFSTALALILRVWDMPTRLVIGFKGGELDSATGAYLFRDKHAHAWVEVYFAGLGWVEFDPTPGVDAAETSGLAGSGYLGRMIDRVSALAGRLRFLAATKWNNSVIGYSRKQQERVLGALTACARAFATGAGEVIRGLGPMVLSFGWVRMAAVTLSIAVVVATVYLLATTCARRAGVRWPGLGADRPPPFYEELLALLRKRGLPRPPHITPRELARRAQARMTASDAYDSQMVQAIELVTDLYYRVRFGGHGLTEDERRDVRDALRRLAALPATGFAAPESSE